MYDRMHSRVEGCVYAPKRIHIWQILAMSAADTPLILEPAHELICKCDHFLQAKCISCTFNF